jgi:transposase InsO family protein
LGDRLYIYHYLVRNLKVERTNQVWAIDITYVPMQKGFMYLTAIIDVYSRYKENKIQLVFIQPGKPMQNAFVERCNGSIRRELLITGPRSLSLLCRTMSNGWRACLRTSGMIRGRKVLTALTLFRL